MKKRWIPLIIACIAAAFVFGLQMGSRSEVEQQGAQDIQEHITTTIAVVNADIGAYTNGVQINYAAALIDTLDYNFTLVSPAMAQTGLQSGMYSAVVTFPSNVSTRILSFNAHQPERVELEFIISPTLSDREFLETFIAITELQLAINTTLANTYVSSILGQFHYAQDHVDGVFQNNLADLLALELLTHGDFTYNLHLDYVPLIPLNAQELDREFYMGQVASFAEEVASWYLHSYEMASNQFLWMREGLFALTENFPDQKYAWLDMLTEWTRLSEEYGELLEIYSAYVRNHDESLYDWFHENVDWNNALEDFQWHLAAWHETSTQWFETWEVWHQDYLDYLDAVIEFREALDTFHNSLDESAIAVITDLDLFLLALEEYEYNLYRQFGLLIETLRAYDAERMAANDFFGAVSDWHENLGRTQQAFENWQGDVNERQKNLREFHEDLGGIREIIEGIANNFLNDVEMLPSIPPMPANFCLEDYWDAIYIPAIPSIAGLPPLPDGRDISFDGAPTLVLPPYVPFNFTTPSTAVLLEDVPTDPSLAMVTPQVTSVDFPPLPSPFLGQDAFQYQLEIMDWLSSQAEPSIVNYFNAWIATEVEGVINNAYTQVLGWRDELYEAAHGPTGWYTQLAIIIGLIEAYHVPLSGWHGQLSGLVSDIDEWYDIINTATGLLNDWHRDLYDLHGNMEDAHDYLIDWHDDLYEISEMLSDLNTALHNFMHGSYCTDGVEFTNGLLYVGAAFHELYNEWFPLDMPPMPCYEEWEELITPTDTVIALPPEATLLDFFDPPGWYEEIAAPDSYRGAQIHYAFNLGFPLDEHAMSEPFGMAPPPQYTGILQPDTVGDHTMITAFQPLNPLVGAPPQPDNFWHSLNFMHDQLSSFDVRDFLSDDIHSRVDRSLQSYDAFLASISDDIVHLFSDNILRMYDVNAEYNHFLQDLRWATFAAQAYEHNALQHAIDAFAEARIESGDDTQGRLGTFASMMPESRRAGSVNQELVNFAVSPFDFVPLEMRDEVPALIFADPSVEAFELYQRVAVIVLIGVLFVTLVGSLIAQYVKGKRNREG